MQWQRRQKIISIWFSNYKSIQSSSIWNCRLRIFCNVWKPKNRWLKMWLLDQVIKLRRHGCNDMIFTIDDKCDSRRKRILAAQKHFNVIRPNSKTSKCGSHWHTPSVSIARTLPKGIRPIQLKVAGTFSSSLVHLTASSNALIIFNFFRWKEITKWAW